MKSENNDSNDQPPDRKGGQSGKPSPELFIARVDGQAIELANPKPTGADILKAAGRLPTEQYILIQLLERSSRSVSPGEPVKLSGRGIELFRSFCSDRVLRLFLDGDDYDWGADSISEADLREIGAVPEEFALEQILAGGNRRLEPGETISLENKGAEQFRRVKRLVKVFLGEAPHMIPPGVYTTEKLIKVLGVKPGYVLGLVNEDGALELLPPGKETLVKDGMRFLQQVPCGGSS